MPDEPGAASPPRSPSAVNLFFNHLLKMPRLHKKLMAVAVLLAGGGTVGQVSSYFSGAGQTTSQQTMDAGHSNPVVAESAAPHPATAPAADPTVVERVSPVAQKLGLGFIAGFIIGWAFRTFIKVMSLITIAGVALFAGLAYFGVDMSTIKTRFESGMGWVSQQSEDLADKAMKRLPGSAAGVTGMVFGFKRKK